MPKAGEILEKNGKKYTWISTGSSGYWSQHSRVAQGSSSAFCDRCERIRGISEKDRTLLTKYDLFIYKAFGMCNTCFQHVNSHREKFLKEYDRIQEIKNQPQKDEKENG